MNGNLPFDFIRDIQSALMTWRIAGTKFDTRLSWYLAEVIGRCGRVKLMVVDVKDEAIDFQGARWRGGAARYATDL